MIRTIRSFWNHSGLNFLAPQTTFLYTPVLLLYPIHKLADGFMSHKIFYGLIVQCQLQVANVQVNGSMAVGAQPQPLGMHFLPGILFYHLRLLMHLFGDKVVKGEGLLSFTQGTSCRALVHRVKLKNLRKLEENGHLISNPGCITS